MKTVLYKGEEYVILVESSGPLIRIVPARIPESEYESRAFWIMRDQLNESKTAKEKLTPAQRFHARINNSPEQKAALWEREQTLCEHFLSSKGNLAVIGPEEEYENFCDWYEEKTGVDARAEEPSTKTYVKYTRASKYALQLQGHCPLPKDESLLTYFLSLEGIYIRSGNVLEINGFERWALFIEYGARLGKQHKEEYAT